MHPQLHGISSVSRNQRTNLVNGFEETFVEETDFFLGIPWHLKKEKEDAGREIEWMDR